VEEEEHERDPFWCEMEVWDIEDVVAGFGAFGYPLTDEPDEADLWLINTYLSLIFLIYFLFCIYILLP
jgi:hypothetical protein